MASISYKKSILAIAYTAAIGMMINANFKGSEEDQEQLNATCKNLCISCDQAIQIWGKQFTPKEYGKFYAKIEAIKEYFTTVGDNHATVFISSATAFLEDIIVHVKERKQQILDLIIKQADELKDFFELGEDFPECYDKAVEINKNIQIIFNT